MNELVKQPVIFALGAVIVIGFLYYLARKTVSDAAGAINDARLNVGGVIGETIYEWFHPPSNIPDIHYAVLFPDGARHAIHATQIDSSGRFSYGGRKWRIGINQSGIRVAVPQ
jgi:hypothetical protein